MNWLADNWLVVLGIICYVLQHSAGVSKAWKTRAALLMGAVNNPGVGKSIVRESPLGNCVKLNSVLDVIEPKSDGNGKKKRRAPVGKVVLDKVLDFVPLLNLLRR